MGQKTVRIEFGDAEVIREKLGTISPISSRNIGRYAQGNMNAPDLRTCRPMVRLLSSYSCLGLVRLQRCVGRSPGEGRDYVQILPEELVDEGKRKLSLRLYRFRDS